MLLLFQKLLSMQINSWGTGGLPRQPCLLPSWQQGGEVRKLISLAQNSKPQRSVSMRLEAQTWPCSVMDFCITVNSLGWGSHPRCSPVPGPSLLETVKPPFCTSPWRRAASGSPYERWRRSSLGTVLKPASWGVRGLLWPVHTRWLPAPAPPAALARSHWTVQGKYLLNAGRIEHTCIIYQGSQYPSYAEYVWT